MLIALRPSRLGLFAAYTRAILAVWAVLALSFAAGAQQPETPQQPAPVAPVPTSAVAPDTAQTPALTSPAADPAQAQVPAEQITAAATSVPASISDPEAPRQNGIAEEDLKKMLIGKLLYLRGGYLDDSLSFNEHGQLTGHSPQGSYTLSGVAIDKVRLTKHTVELEGQRYGLHFLGALPSEDPTTAMDRVLITPKKKVLRITIDRETVVVPKKAKEKGKNGKSGPPASTQPALAATQPEPQQPTDADQLKHEIAASPAAERPADPASVTTTTSPAHAAALMKDAINQVFSVGFDPRMMAAMPDFWKLYYQAVAARTDYRPQDPAVLRQSAVDKKARLVSVFEPASNEYAQSHGVAGLALYHVVIGADGMPGEIAVARPIGFGLDESAAASIRKASFEAAIKDGKQVPVVLDLIVEFHIYSGRTGIASKLEPPDKGKLEAAEMPAAPLLPGPYSVRRP